MRWSLLIIILFVASIFCQQQKHEQNYIHRGRHGTPGRQKNSGNGNGLFPNQKNRYPDRDIHYQQLYGNHKPEADRPEPNFNGQIVNDTEWEYTWDGEKSQAMLSHSR